MNPHTKFSVWGKGRFYIIKLNLIKRAENQNFFWCGGSFGVGVKILIAYYSRTGGTEKLAEVVKKEFESRGHLVDIEKIKPKKEHNFFAWWHIRMFKGECDIQPPKIQDVSDYDFICIGSPNWTRLSAPVGKYLKIIKGLKYKKIGFFATTALWPALERYILSAYLLDFTASQAIEKRGGRLIANLLLSSWLKRWSFSSDYGRKNIKNFCAKMEAPIYSYKDYFINQKEIESTRLLIIIFSIFLISSLIFQIASIAFGVQLFSWKEYFSIFASSFFANLLIIGLMERRQKFFMGKYLAGLSLVICWTLIILILAPSFARSIIAGYIFILILIGFFRDFKAVLFSGLITIFCYEFLLVNYPKPGVLIPSIDFPLLFLGIGMVGAITSNLQRHFIALFEGQDEIENARLSLEVKIAARTRELKEFSENLENQVKERTKELQERVDELEKFYRLTVGRELKIIELKEEIKKLKEELEKSKGRPK